MDIVKTITVPIIFVTNEYADNPDSVTLSFTQAEIDRIKHLIDLAKAEDITIRMDVDADELDANGDWRIGYECITIYSTGTLYYYAQNSYDSRIQVESEGFTVDTLTITEHEKES